MPIVFSTVKKHPSPVDAVMLAMEWSGYNMDCLKMAVQICWMWAEEGHADAANELAEKLQKGYFLTMRSIRW